VAFCSDCGCRNSKRKQGKFERLAAAATQVRKNLKNWQKKFEKLAKKIRSWQLQLEKIGIFWETSD